MTETGDQGYALGYILGLVWLFGVGVGVTAGIMDWLGLPIMAPVWSVSLPTVALMVVVMVVVMPFAFGLAGLLGWSILGVARWFP